MSPTNHGDDLVNLPGAVEQIAARFEAGTTARAVRLFVDVAPDALVIGDSLGLRRTLEMLVENVLEKTANGGCVTICGTESHGTVTLTIASHGMVDSVQPNRGAGVVAPSALAGEPSVLSVAESIIEAHGGTMAISYQQPRESRFQIRLPVARTHSN